MARYTVLGTSDDRDTCEVCGKTGLKYVVVLQDSEDHTRGEVFAGKDCAAELLGRGRSEKQAERTWREAQEAEREREKGADTAIFQKARASRFWNQFKTAMDAWRLGGSDGEDARRALDRLVRDTGLGHDQLIQLAEQRGLKMAGDLRPNGFSMDDFEWSEPTSAAPSEESRAWSAFTDLKRDDVIKVGAKKLRIINSQGVVKYAILEGTKGRKFYKVFPEDRQSPFQVTVCEVLQQVPEKLSEPVASGAPIKIDVVEPNGPSHMPRSQASFDRHFDEMATRFPDFGELELHHDEAAGGDNGHGSERQFGFCSTEPPWQISFAAKIEKLPGEYIDGLMAHEFGHAIDHRYGRAALERVFGKRLPDSVERRADKIAEYTFGRPVEYGDLDIQCVACGGKPTRPRKLG